MNKLKEKIRSLMIGRYGIDELNIAIVSLSLIFYILSLFIKKYNLALMWMGTALLILNIYRSYSKNIPGRRRENEKFLEKTLPARAGFKRMKRNITDKDNKYISCPSCNQELRVPKRKGKILVTCSKCKKKFNVRT